MGVNRKLIVEILDARSLLPKDGHGTSSPYVVVDFYGQRKRTHTVLRDLNPVWNEVLEFNVGGPSDVFGDMLELDVYHDRVIGPTRRNNFLGRIRLSSSQFVRKGEEALIYFPLEKKSFFSWIQGEIGLKVYYVDEPSRPPSPPPAEASPPAAEAAGGEKVETADPPAPPTDPPKTEEVSDPPAAETKNNEEIKEGEKTDVPAEPAAATPPEEAAPVAEPNASPEKVEKPPDVVIPPPEATAAPVASSPQPPPPEPSPPPPPPPQQEPERPDFRSFETTHDWIPQPEHSASPAVMSRTSSNVKLAGGFNPPQPISRQTTTESFYLSDPSRNTPPIEKSTFDLVEKMHYLFIKIVKARQLPTSNSPIVKISVSNRNVISNPGRKLSSTFEFHQTFAFSRESQESLSTMEISLWDSHLFLGGICFDTAEIPVRDPPDSSLAPQWYRLEGGGAHHGDLMLATWIGTQADEAFQDCWKSDTSATVSSKSKIYLSPKLWYLRATVIEAQDILPLRELRESSFQIKAQLGFQVLKTKPAVSRTGSPLFNEDLIFVASEPFSDHLIFSLETRLSKGSAVLGITGVPLASIERRVDDRKVVSRWFSLEDSNEEKKSYRGRVHLRLCYDGGYHVMDESAHVCSDYRPTARQLWKPPVGTVELGIVGCKNLIPMKTINGKGTTDAYSVAKYGQKWIRTRTVSDSLDPKWNEQYTWRVYDLCTVLTLGVFDSWGVHESKDPTRQDYRIGKVRIRISTLQTGKVYRNTYPLLLLTPNGLKKMGDVEIAVRFARAVPTLDIFHVYTQPMLPLMHHIKPLGVVQQDLLRNIASKVVAQHLSRSEPPLPREVVLYMLDADTHVFSMRKVRANWYRIINVAAGVIDVVRWIEDTRSWKNPTSTPLVHALVVMLVWFPNLIVPTLAFYLFVIGAWNYRFRSRDPLPHLDAKISLADIVDRDELDEEFDTLPSGRPDELVRMRYDKLRTLGARVQTVLGDIATQGERMQALVTWRDPRATGIFVGLCLVVAVVLYLVPSKMVAMAMGFYYLRHPMFRDRMPSPALNFFRRLPSLTAQMM